MVSVRVYYRGADTRRLRLPAVPHTGAYLQHDGQLWRVVDVVFGGQGVAVYAVRVSNTVISDLEATWATWGEQP